MAGSQFIKDMTSRLKKEAIKQTIFSSVKYDVEVGMGKGRWADVPWLAFLDPLISDSAQKGIYIVYLVNSNDKTLTLSMNQGATNIFGKFKGKHGIDDLRRRALDIQGLFPEYSKFFDGDQITLGSDGQNPRGYVAGHAFGRTYRLHEINSPAFYKDLENMLYAYKIIVDRGRVSQEDLILNEDEAKHLKTIDETRKYIMSRRIERNSGVRKDVLKIKAPVCEGCGLDPRTHYSYKGEIQNTPLDVHHCIPLNSLSETEKSRYTIPDDFLVLCPTCHRMIHKQDDKSDLNELKRKITFELPKGVMKN